jgi:nucleoside-diphosphate-sugar epimerase
MKKILVTGAGGFIGHHLGSVLARSGHELHAADLCEPSRPQAGFLYHQIDLMAYDKVDAFLAWLRPSHLIQLAWMTAHGSYWASPSNLDWTGATLHLVKAFREHGGERAVVAGTCAEYDWTAPSPFSEAETPCHPNTLYGMAKLSTLRILESYARVSGLSFAWGRIFFLFGAGEGPRRLVPSILSRILSGTPAICRNPNLIRDFLHVEDVARAFAAVLDSNAEGVLNIASGQATRIGDLVTMLGEVTGRADLIRLEPTPQSDEPGELVASVARLAGETSFRPSLALNEAVRRAVKEYRECHTGLTPS